MDNRNGFKAFYNSIIHKIKVSWKPILERNYLKQTTVTFISWMYNKILNELMGNN